MRRRTQRHAGYSTHGGLACVGAAAARPDTHHPEIQRARVARPARVGDRKGGAKEPAALRVPYEQLAAGAVAPQNQRVQGPVQCTHPRRVPCGQVVARCGERPVTLRVNGVARPGRRTVRECPSELLPDK